MSGFDPLASFRRKEAEATPAPATAPGEKSPYVAFKVENRSPSLSIRCRPGDAYPIGWAFIYVTPYDRKTQDRINIIANVMVVEIRGRNLGPVAEALEARKCDYIQEYDPELFEEPDADEPVVTDIQILAGPGKKQRT